MRRGLLRPETGAKGGGNPYQIFTPAHVETARTIRLAAESLGFSLLEILALNSEHQAGNLTPERSLAIMTQQLSKIEEKANHLNALVAYLRDKVA